MQPLFKNVKFNSLYKNGSSFFKTVLFLCKNVSSFYKIVSSVSLNLRMQPLYKM